MIKSNRSGYAYARFCIEYGVQNHLNDDSLYAVNAWVYEDGDRINFDIWEDQGLSCMLIEYGNIMLRSAFVGTYEECVNYIYDNLEVKSVYLL